jgi:hypothetical protein
MKKLITPLLLLLITGAACHAQESHLDQFYHKYDTDGSETTRGTINLALLLNFAANDSAESWTKKVTMCRFMTMEPEKSAKAGEEWKELTQSLKDDNFEEWMSIRKGKEHLRLMAKERKDGQEDVVCVASGDHGGGVFFHLRGRFNADDKARIEAAMQSGRSEGI